MKNLMKVGVVVVVLVVLIVILVFVDGYGWFFEGFIKMIIVFVVGGGVDIFGCLIVEEV